MSSNSQMSTPPLSRLQSLQTLRGVAVLLVIGLHAYAFESKAGVGPGLLPWYSILGSSGVDLFFVISGFVMVYTTKNVSASPKAFAVFLYKRFSRIYPLYWVLTTALLLGYALFPSLIARTNITQIDMLKAFLLFPQEALPYLQVGWTLIHEMYFYIVFAFSLLIARERLLHFLMGWLLLVFALDCMRTEGSSPLFKLISDPLTIEFILGCGAALLLSSRPALPSRYCIPLGVITLLITWYFFHTVNQGVALSGWTRAILLGVPYAVIVFGATAEERKGRFFRSKTLESIGDASYSIYLLHFLVISFVSKIWFRFGIESNDSYFDNLLYLVVSAVASLILGWYSYRMLERPSMGAAKGLLNRLVG